MNLPNPQRRPGHTLMEVTVAMIASTVLLAGLGAVMLIARQIAYAPSAASRQTEAVHAVNRIADELRYATLILEQTSRVLEFVVADRTDNGAAERIRYEWSGTPGDPLLKTLNGSQPVAVLDSAHDFQITPTVTAKITPLTTTVESSEGLLVGTSMSLGSSSGITADYWLARRIDPVSQFPASVGGINKNAATSWNARRVRFYGRNQIAPHAGTVFVQLRATGDPSSRPTSQIVGEIVVSETQISSGLAWNNAMFLPAVQGLSLNRRYSLAWEGDKDTLGSHAVLTTATSTAGNVSKSTNQGASWEAEPLEAYFELYGTYTMPGPTYNVTRRFVPHVAVLLQGGGAEHSRIDASTPLVNKPELLSAYWRLDRADFDDDPTTIDLNGDGAADWAAVGSTIQTRPLHDFTAVTVVEARCRATGGGDVIRINADRQAGLHAPLFVQLQHAAGFQSLTLLSKSSDGDEVTLKTVENLSSGFLRVRLMIVPEHGLVNLQINGEDVGSYTYPRYAPSSSDRCVTVFHNTGSAEFDYVEVRAAAN